MSIFQWPGDQDRLDWAILQSSPICLYYRRSILDEDASCLERLGYRLAIFNCLGWQSEEDFHDDVSRVLRFPAYYGRNLDALNDCLRDIEIPDEGGMALIFLAFHCFVSKYRERAQIILDIIAAQARSALLLGKRLIAMVQSDDPQLRFEPVGACPVIWNPREWLDSSRQRITT